MIKKRIEKLEEQLNRQLGNQGGGLPSYRERILAVERGGGFEGCEREAECELWAQNWRKGLETPEGRRDWKRLWYHVLGKGDPRLKPVLNPLLDENDDRLVAELLGLV